MDKKCLENLKQIIDATSARIVLTSSWRLFPKSRAQIDASLKEIKLDPILGWTSSQGKSRVDEIYSWLQNFDNKLIDEDIIVKKWIAIDDMNLLQLDQQRMHDHFVLTMEKQGITDETVRQAILLLS